MNNKKQVQLTKAMYYFYKTIYLLSMTVWGVIFLLFMWASIPKYFDGSIQSIVSEIMTTLFVLAPVILTQKLLTVEAFVARKINREIIHRERLIKKMNAPKSFEDNVFAPEDYEFLHSDWNNHTDYDVANPYSSEFMHFL